MGREKGRRGGWRGEEREGGVREGEGEERGEVVGEVFLKSKKCPCVYTMICIHENAMSHSPIHSCVKV